MKFEIDVLIIFASRDNEQPAPGETGWVTQFRRFLELMLIQVLGEKPNILLKDQFDTLTSPNLDNAATLITILSNDFVQSGQSLDQLEAFFNTSVALPTKANRIFKVFKSPLSLAEQPPRLRELSGYEMYQLDPTSGESSEYLDYFSIEAERQYWMKMVDLAYDIYDTLLQIKGDNLSTDKRLFHRKTVYLAECGHDVAVHRNIIRRELQRNGYLVLPTQTMTGAVHDLERKIEKELSDSDLSIHLIGGSYGEIPEDADQSIPEIQLRLAAERDKISKESGTSFSRLIWLSPNLSQLSDKQRLFIERINTDVDTQENTEILQMPIEDFKVILQEELMGRESFAEADAGRERRVYIMHDRVDLEEARQLASLIQSNGFQIAMPVLEGDIMEVRKKHIENLINLDIALIFRGKVNEQWVRMKALDLVKAPGYGRKKPMIGKFIVTTSPAELNADSYKKQDLKVLQGNLEKSVESLKNLLEELAH
jgi:hypothetical protein